MNNPNFTQEQIDFICSQIGNWYMDWKYKINSNGESTHRLGFAKEELKMAICDTSIEHYREYRVEITRLYPNYKFRIFMFGAVFESVGILIISYEDALNKAKEVIDKWRN